MEIGNYENCIDSIPLGNIAVHPSEKAKNLGFMFDDQLSLNAQVNAVTQKCFMSLRNIGRIGSKLTQTLKVQLMHSCVLSVLDYCNSVFGSLSETNLRKLQKIQNSAVWFIFGLKGKQKHQSITPYLKKLHFLPVKYRIQYKIALLVFKCLNNIAPKYLSEMITIRDPNNHSLRIDEDYYLLKSPPIPQLKRTEGAFSVAAPKIWNSLPFNLRCICDVNNFKKCLKTHYFNTAFEKVD